MNDSDNSQDISLLLNEGQGRAFVVIYDEDRYAAFAQSICEILRQRSKVLLFKTIAVGTSNWLALSLNLKTQIEELGLRQVSFVSLGSAGALVQYLSLTEAKLVRSLVLVDASCKPHPNWRDRLVDKLEKSLPLGLPFRSSTQGFDSKSFLQRLRFPILLVLTHLAGEFLVTQAFEMAASLPTAWVVKLSSESPEIELAKLIEEFQDVPVKCPQKKTA